MRHGMVNDSSNSDPSKSSLPPNGNSGQEKLESKSCGEIPGSEASNEKLNSEACIENLNSEVCNENLVSEICNENLNSEVCNENLVSGTCNENLVSETCNETLVSEACKDTIVSKACNEKLASEACSEKFHFETRSKKLEYEAFNEKFDSETCSEKFDIEACNEKSDIELCASTSRCCRICMQEGSERLISPCLCKGTLAFIHASCLDHWLNQSNRSYCELCLFHYITLQRRRYTLCQSLRIWIFHPRHWLHIRTSLFMLLVAVILSALVLISCMLGMQKFVNDMEKHGGIPPMWTSSFISFLITIVLLSLVFAIFQCCRTHLTPWYHWWRNCMDIHLAASQNISMVMAQCQANVHSSQHNSVWNWPFATMNNSIQPL